MSTINSPEEIVEIASQAANKKEKYSAGKIIVSAFLAGAYISFGGLLAFIIGGGVPGIAAENPGIQKFLFGAAFPVGLMLVVLAGAELFTGNTAYFTPNILNGKQKVGVMFRNWFWVYLGNFIGALFVAYFITYLTEVVSQSPWSDSVLSVATGKVSNPFYKTFLKGIGANWLVCLAMWLAMSAKTTTGKIVGLWWPVMTFVAIGFEHSIANMFFIPLAMLQGADISWTTFIVKNLIPATLGNIVGGLLFVGVAYWYLYSRPRELFKG